MGWCSGTIIFDTVCEALLENETVDKRDALESIIDELEGQDWDCQKDSGYWDHPLVVEIMKERHPRWFQGKEDE